MRHITLKEMLETEVNDILNDYKSGDHTYYYKYGESKYHEIVELNLLRGGFKTEAGEFIKFELELEKSHIYEEKYMRAKIISAFPACGKTTYYKDWSQYSPENVWRKRNDGKQVYNNIGEPCGDKILDSDSSLFSWIYDENGNKTDKRNPDFPNNYIKYIKEHIDSEDVIFVSSHKVVRDALKEENIPYYLIYPKKDMKNEWMYRFKNRGNNEAFIKFQDEHWDEFIDDMDNEAITTTLMNGIMEYTVKMFNEQE